jgi:hypothetical protein
MLATEREKTRMLKRIGEGDIHGIPKHLMAFLKNWPAGKFSGIDLPA